MILFLDASTTTVGWVLGDDVEETVIASGAIKLSGFNTEGSGWVWRVRNLELWLSMAFFTKRPVNQVVYEIPTGNRMNMATNRKLGAVEYVILKACQEANIPCDGITASQVRASGVHKKALDAAAAYKGSPLGDRLQEDEADALGVMKAWWKFKRTGIIITEGD